MKKLPPVEKIYEAFSAIADERVKIQENSAIVVSSNGAKTYNVLWNENTYRASDNATYWQGYPGYPVIAVLMLQNKLPYSKSMVALWSGINWTELNSKYKRNYASAVEEVMHGLEDKGIDVDEIKRTVNIMYGKLAEWDIKIGRLK